MEAAISYVPIERENSRIVSLSLQTINDRKLLFGVTTYTVAVWNFTSTILPYSISYDPQLLVRRIVTKTRVVVLVLMAFVSVLRSGGVSLVLLVCHHMKLF
jgi:hypothetical protein